MNARKKRTGSTSKQPAQPAKTFAECVRKTPDLAGCLKSGLQALRSQDRRKITVRNPRKLRGSVFIEECLTGKKDYEGQPLWDYVVGLAGNPADRVWFIEVHPAASSHVKTVLKKLEWLRNWLDQHACCLNALERRFLWVSSSRVDIPQHAPQRRLLAQNGLELHGRLEIQ